MSKDMRDSPRANLGFPANMFHGKVWEHVGRHGDLPYMDAHVPSLLQLKIASLSSQSESIPAPEMDDINPPTSEVFLPKKIEKCNFPSRRVDKNSHFPNLFRGYLVLFPW